MKRSADQSDDRSHSHKKHKNEHSHRERTSSNTNSHSRLSDVNERSHSYDKQYPTTPSARLQQSHHDASPKHPKQKQKPSHEEALAQLPPPLSKSASVPSYVPFTIPPSLPPLPEVTDGALSTAPFIHKSSGTYNRSSSGQTDITYERLEFIGDAYIELIASRLIFERFGHLTAGQQSQLRELLVKNETLAEYSRAYGFEDRIEAKAVERMLDDGRHKGNKGFNKVLGDVLEAYVAAVILSDAEDGFAKAEKWLTGLWAHKLLEATRSDRSYAASANGSSVVHAVNADLSKVYNPTAKADLQRRIFDSSIKLAYEPYKGTVELKGDQLGQNKHFVAVYLTGYGYDRKLLGKGEGKNKVEAGNWAATDAMYGECKEVVDACEEKLKVTREERKAKKEATEKAKARAGS